MSVSWRDVEGLRAVPHPEWDGLVARLGGDDAYLRLGWHTSAAVLEVAGTRPVLLHVTLPGGELALPLLLRPLPGGGWDATSAYGYGGPVATGTPDPAQVRARLDHWGRENGVVCTFLRFHPLLGNQRWCPAGATLIPLGTTVCWNIAPDHDLLASMHSHHRRAARRADRDGVTTRIREDVADLGEFAVLYVHTMRRQSAASFYFFGPDYWAALPAHSGGRVVLAEGLLDGSVVAALLLVAHGDTLHYHLGATDDAGRAGASHRTFLAAAEWGRAQGLRRFHLGGGVGADTTAPLFVFKHRFDPAGEPLPFAIAKLVHDPGAYRALAGTDSVEGYFPPWRA
ncbi:MAG: GNAT family N-acetyltransferase [Thermoleophilia bacterium]